MLTRMEELLLLAVWRLQHDAYGLAIRRTVSDLLGKKVSVGASSAITPSSPAT